MTIDAFPGGDGSILDPGKAEGLAEKVVTRRALYPPKDEVPPPEGSGTNWFEYNYKPMPPVLSIRLQINPRQLSDALHPFVESSDMPGFLNICRNAKIEIDAEPGNPIVTLRLIP